VPGESARRLPDSPSEVYDGDAQTFWAAQVSAGKTSVVMHRAPRGTLAQVTSRAGGVRRSAAGSVSDGPREPKPGPPAIGYG